MYESGDVGPYIRDVSRRFAEAILRGWSRRNRHRRRRIHELESRRERVDQLDTDGLRRRKRERVQTGSL